MRDPIRMIHSFQIRCLLAACCMLSTFACAQPDVAQGDMYTHHFRFGFTTGPQLGFLRDWQYSPLNYNENGWLTSLWFENINPKNNRLLTAAIDYASGESKTNASDAFTTKRFEGNVELSLLFKTRFLHHQKLSLFLGPQINSTGFYMQWKEERHAWDYLMMHSLNVKALLHYQIASKSFLRTSLSIPLMGMLVRPPYNGFDQFIAAHQEKVFRLAFRGDFASVDSYRAFDWRTNYYYALSDHFDVGAMYLFRFQSAENNELMRFQHQLAASLVFKF
jgi:hypothetical protein